MGPPTYIGVCHPPYYDTIEGRIVLAEQQRGRKSGGRVAMETSLHNGRTLSKQNFVKKNRGSFYCRLKPTLYTEAFYRRAIVKRVGFEENASIT